MLGLTWDSTVVLAVEARDGVDCFCITAWPVVCYPYLITQEKSSCACSDCRIWINTSFTGGNKKKRYFCACGIMERFLNLESFNKGFWSCEVLQLETIIHHLFLPFLKFMECDICSSRLRLEPFNIVTQVLHDVLLSIDTKDANIRKKFKVDVILIRRK